MTTSHPLNLNSSDIHTHSDVTAGNSDVTTGNDVIVKSNVHVSETVTVGAKADCSHNDPVSPLSDSGVSDPNDNKNLPRESGRSNNRAARDMFFFESDDGDDECFEGETENLTPVRDRVAEDPFWQRTRPLVLTGTDRASTGRLTNEQPSCAIAQCFTSSRRSLWGGLGEAGSRRAAHAFVRRAFSLRWMDRGVVRFIQADQLSSSIRADRTRQRRHTEGPQTLTIPPHLRALERNTQGTEAVAGDTFEGGARPGDTPGGGVRTSDFSGGGAMIRNSPIMGGAALAGRSRSKSESDLHDVLCRFLGGEIRRLSDEMNSTRLAHTLKTVNESTSEDSSDEM